MKKILFIAALATIASFVSCQVTEEMESTGTEGLEFTAIISPDTKTMVDLSSGKVSWESSDMVTISDGTNTALYIIKEIINNKYAVFKKCSGDDLNTSGVTYTATYGTEPLNNQYYKEQVGGIPMTATSESTSLQFRVTCGLLNVNLGKTGESIKTISVTGTPEGGIRSTYTLNCTSPVSIDGGKDFWIVLPEGSYDMFEFTTADNLSCTKMAKEGNVIMIEKNKIHKISFKESLSFAPKYATLYFKTIMDYAKENNVTEIVFNTESDTKTENCLTTDVPVYYSLSGTKLNLFTQARLYRPWEAFPKFNDVNSLETIDLSKIDFTNTPDFTYLLSGLENLKSVTFGKNETANPSKMKSTFQGCKSLETIDFGTLNVSQVQTFDGCFQECAALKELKLSGWGTSKAISMNKMFYKCTSLTSLDLSSLDVSKVTDFTYCFAFCDSLEELDLTGWDTSEATNMNFMFCGCKALEELDISPLNTSNVTTMNCMFSGCTSLEALDFSSFRTPKLEKLSNMFNSCSSLTTLDLSSFDVSNIESFEFCFTGCSSLKNIKLTGWNTSKATSMASMFSGCLDLEELNLNSFNTSNVTSMSNMFYQCKSLKTLDLRNFDTSHLMIMGNMFNSCESMTYLDLSSFVLASGCDAYNSICLFASKVEKSTIRCSPETYLLLVNNQGTAPDNVEWDLTSPYEMYESKSYEKDGMVTLLNKATEGKGIDIVFMADAFSDRMIDNGEYDQLMKDAMDALFSEEPYKSCKQFFNVYAVTVVSKNEVISYDTALHMYTNPAWKCDHSVVRKYVQKALGEDCSFDNVTVAAIAHTTAAAGIGSGIMYDIDWENDYGAGFGIGCFGSGSNFDELRRMMLHEFGGHAFAKLGDEYHSSSGTPSQEDVDLITELWRKYGRYKNIDFTNNPSECKWSKFISDPRYATEAIGLYEGGLTCTNGVWRPSYNSIMNSMIPESFTFNAPSREAIYYRIHKLAYGEDWQYDYETFVKFDLKL